MISLAVTNAVTVEKYVNRALKKSGRPSQRTSQAHITWAAFSLYSVRSYCVLAQKSRPCPGENLVHLGCNVNGGLLEGIGPDRHDGLTSCWCDDRRDVTIVDSIPASQDAVGVKTGSPVSRLAPRKRHQASQPPRRNVGRPSITAIAPQ